MGSIETLSAFFGWMAVTHIFVMMAMFAAILIGGEWVRGIHSRLMGLNDDDLSRAYFAFFARYKIGIWFFAIGPWIALQLID